MTTFKWESHFHDTGCQHSPRCQTCPLPRCKYDMTKTEISRLAFAPKRARAVDSYRRLRGSYPGLPTAKLVALAAAEAGVTTRTVYRALEAAMIAIRPG